MGLWTKALGAALFGSRPDKDDVLDFAKKISKTSALYATGKITEESCTDTLLQEVNNFLIKFGDI